MFDYMEYIMYLCNTMIAEVGRKYVFMDNLSYPFDEYSGKSLVVTKVTTRTVWAIIEGQTEARWMGTKEFINNTKPFGTWGNSKIKFHFA